MAAYGSWRLPLKAAVGLFFALACLGVAAVVPYFIWAEKESPGLLLLALLPLGFCAIALVEGISRLRQWRETGCFLRAGPEGLSMHLPGALRRSSCWLAYDLWEFDFRWDEVESLGWTPGGRRSLLVRARGGTLELDGDLFQEPSAEILARIRAAAAPAVPPIPKTTL